MTLILERKIMGSADWYDEEALNAIWEAIGVEQTALAEMGIDDYTLNLQQLDEN